jgi:hypothetical protein
MKSLSKTEIAIANAKTVFGNRVKQANRDTMGKTELLIKRSTNVKLGKKITKGKFAGFPIYTLTLEERATCPRSCAHWADCYGNNMMYAYRYAAGPALEAMLEAELSDLQRKHPRGFMVRLHILGDFYSVSYVAKWASWLGKFPALHIYGYTANNPFCYPTKENQKEREIGQAILSLRTACPDRFAIRFSGNFDDESGWTANSYDDQRAVAAVQAKQAFLCPTQISKTTGKYAQKGEETLVPDCGACGLCWTAKKPVVFITH